MCRLFRATSVLAAFTLTGLALSVTSGAPRTQLARLFDYESYKQTFGKSYAGELENSVRKCYFYARALDAFVSGVNYKYRHADYFKALNEMSDWTPEERARVMNRRPSSGSEAPEKPLAFMPVAGENPEETLRKYLVDHADESPVYRELLTDLDRGDSSGQKGLKRTKRHSGGGGGGAPRDFSFARLVNADAGDAKARAAEKPVRVESNNPNYEGFELETRGLDDQLQEVDFVSLDEPEAEPGSLERKLEETLGWLNEGGKTAKRARKGKKTLSDEIFFDHRSSGCLSEVRSQGVCGCCYAFASIALAEWLYCKTSGQLVAFSEQYMVDCGKNRFDIMLGCSGATDSAVVDFIHNFGLELRAQYPYRGREGACPYDKDTDLRTTGYIRMDLGGFVEVPMRLWAKALPLTPMYIRIEMDETFLDYGGGVYDGSRCRQVAEGDDGDSEDGENYHSMLLVGHGREDGQEYWLIRNSHGKHWGEHGYFKLAKDAPKGCVPRQVAYAFGTRPVRPRTNELNDQSKVSESKSPKRKATKARRRFF